MCCVMPPCSDAVTFVSRMASSRLVLPWSTWPMIVTTGGRDCSFVWSSSIGGRAGRALDGDFGVLLRLRFERLEAHVRRDDRGRVEVDDLVDRGHDAVLHQLFDDLDGRDVHEVAELLHGEDARYLDRLERRGWSFWLYFGVCRHIRSLLAAVRGSASACARSCSTSSAGTVTLSARASRSFFSASSQHARVSWT